MGVMVGWKRGREPKEVQVRSGEKRKVSKSMTEYMCE